MKISVVLREAPQKLRDHLLVNSQQFESYCNKLKAIIQAYLNTNKTWIASDFRESDPMDVDHISKRKIKSKGKSKGSNEDKSQDKSKCKNKKRQRQRQRKARQRQRMLRVRKKVSSRTRLLVTSQQPQNGE